jgi:hypothetical protein
LIVCFGERESLACSVSTASLILRGGKGVLIHTQPAPRDSYSRLLRQITDDLLSAQVDDEKQRAATIQLYSLFSSITGIADSTHPDDIHAAQLAGGKAIAPKDAATCILDYNRTSKFLSGTKAAILAAQQRFPDTTIEILYAGCGPFAPFAIPLTSQFSSSEIRFTLLDIHQRSLDAVQLLFQTLGLNAFVDDYIKSDATTYKHDEQKEIHVIITEAMQRALEKEPQAAITMNLASQLCAGGIFIPESITIDACLCDLRTEFTLLPAESVGLDSLPDDRAAGRLRIHLGRVLELTAESCRELSVSGGKDDPDVAAPFPKVVITVPKDTDTELDLMLSTSITVFDSIVLGDYESGLTCPAILHDLGKLPGGARVEFQYRMGNKPGFEYRLL